MYSGLGFYKCEPLNAKKFSPLYCIFCLWDMIEYYDLKLLLTWFRCSFVGGRFCAVLSGIRSSPLRSASYQTSRVRLRLGWGLRWKDSYKKKKYFVTMLYMYEFGDREIRLCIPIHRLSQLGRGLFSNDRYLYISDLPLLHRKRKACVICNVSWLFVLFVISFLSLYT